MVCAVRRLRRKRWFALAAHSAKRFRTETRNGESDAHPEDPWRDLAEQAALENGSESEGDVEEKKGEEQGDESDGSENSQEEEKEEAEEVENGVEPDDGGDGSGSEEGEEEGGGSDSEEGGEREKGGDKANDSGDTIDSLLPVPLSVSITSSKKKEKEKAQKLLESQSGETFKELGLCPELCVACEAMGWKHPTAIQKAAIPIALKGKDVVGLAETGSGKTAAFALPIIQSLLDSQQRLFAVVLVPTRELAVQIADQFRALGAAICLAVATILGGMPMKDQALALLRRPHIVVASPGRLADHLENTKGFSLKSVKYLVMDEADRLLADDFEDALDKILAVLPKQRHTFLFSATMTARVSKLQVASLVNPVKVEVSSKYDTSSGLVQHFKLLPEVDKVTFLAALLAKFQSCSAIVFASTCLKSKQLSVILRHLGFLSVCLFGQMTQTQRLGALNAFKSGSRRVLVATDLASRGLDIPSVDLVVNFDVPLTGKDYVHRVGRTARAGRTGRAVTLVTQYDVQLLIDIEKALGQKLPVYIDIVEEEWRRWHDKVEEARTSAEMELKEEDGSKRGMRRGRIQKRLAKKAGGRRK